jgi:hypothetical protein
MNRNIKYKQVCRVQLFGDDDVYTTAMSQYSCPSTALPGINIISAGTNYAAASTQIVISGGGGNNATASVTVSSGGISAITWTNSGSGYTNVPNISITSGITNTTSLVGGSAYFQSNVGVIISGGNGSGATATATVTSNAISAITITNAGTGYTIAPTISFTSGVTGYTITSGGTGYANGPFNVGISGGGGSGAVVTATAVSGVITAVTITTAGTGYTSVPTLEFSAGGGTGANIAAKIGTGASATAVIGTGANASITAYTVNSKRMRFALNNSLNDLKLSQNARCVVETCNIPSFQTMAGKYVLLRLVVSSQDKTCDTKKFLNGNPILLSMATNAILGSTNVLYNCSEFFYNINVPTNMFSQGYVDMEFECPAAVGNVDFLTGKPLTTFFLNLIIVDEDPELTKDLTLAPPIDYKHYNVNMPIKQY